MMLQVKVPGFSARLMHSATAFSFNAKLIEVILFGGSPEWPKNYRNDNDFTFLAKTTVLRFGEFTSEISQVHRGMERKPQDGLHYAIPGSYSCVPT